MLKFHRRHSLLLTVLLLLCNALGCSSPVSRLQDQAQGIGFGSLMVSAGGYTLSSYYRPAANGGKRLHVYLEGDGRPWEQGLIAAADPTTRASLMLPLMAMDKSAVLYLGRPCYNGRAGDAGCSKEMWTAARYGETVIAAMAKGLQNFCARYSYDEVVLIGHSGGGSLAILLAKHVPQTKALVTLAVNYDIDVWADYHGLQRLTGSANPAGVPNVGIPEWHFLAENDRNIPADLFFQKLKARRNSHVEIVPDIDHNHGWESIWPKILANLE